jgi:hypothetical protein
MEHINGQPVYTFAIALHTELVQSLCDMLFLQGQIVSPCPTPKPKEQPLSVTAYSPLFAT